MHTVIEKVIPDKRIPCQSTREYSVDGGKTWLSYKEFFHWKKSLIKIISLWEMEESQLNT